jgi:DNA-binding response OmpR family regulator
MPTRILFADPDTELIERYRQCLSACDYEVAGAVHGMECLARLRDFAPDLLILEPDLPWGGGEGVLARMVERSDVPIVPVALLAARLDNRILGLMTRFPIEECQLKPVTPDRLTVWIGRLLAHSHELCPPQRIG